MAVRFILSGALFCACVACAYTTDNLDYGVPGVSDQIVERTGYALGYVNAWRQPEWVSYRLTSWEAYGATTRSDDFREDPAIPQQWRATLADYSGSGYDRGHLSPAADNAWSALAMSESFYLSNMSPQKPALNRGLWSRIEAAVRNFAIQEESVVIVTGPVVTNGAHATIGSNAVLVPDGYYKVVYAENYQKMIGFLVWQDSSGAVTNFVRAVDDIEQMTGLDFFSELDDSLETSLENACNIDSWCWDDSAKDDTEGEVWEDYAVDPIYPIHISGLSRSWCARSWALDLSSLTNVYPTSSSRNVAAWTNGVTVPGWQVFVDGVPVTNITRNLGKTTTSGFYAFTTNNASHSFSLGTMTSASAGRYSLGVAFLNDLKSDIVSLDVSYVGRQYGFRNTTVQSFDCEVLATNKLLAVCNGVGWQSPEVLSFVSPVVGNPDSLVHGGGTVVSHSNEVKRLAVRVRPGEYLHLRWSREAAANGAAMGIDNLVIRFVTRGGCIIVR